MVQHNLKEAGFLATAGGAGDTPAHVAIIMDGNRRWAEMNGLPVFEGHRRGVDAVRRTVKSAQELGVKYLSLYSFSTENWSRPEAEVAHLMSLLRLFIRSDLNKLHKENIRICIIGDRDGLEHDLKEILKQAECKTSSNTGLTLIIAFNYGSRQEIIRAMRVLGQQIADGLLKPASISAEILSDTLDTSGIPDPDVVIRTSGEQRLSNFLLWQLAYAEFVFLPVLWPDFAREHLSAAIEEFNQRERRYGGRKALV